MNELSLFYEEPDPNRWVPLDRYPRRLVRRIVRGKPRPGGQRLVFLNLCAGLRRLGVPFRVNDYGHLRRNPGALACVIGKPLALDRQSGDNPILFGASVFSHPSDDPRLLERLPVRRILVPGEWMRRMFEPYYGSAVDAWPVGIDTDRWAPIAGEKSLDVLVYDKILWDHERTAVDVLQPVLRELSARGLSVARLRYGHYREEEFRALLGRAKMMVFLCEHESQGLAYQQALAAGVPLLAWDRGGEWHDPAYYPHRAVFGPVSSVPYWDERCGSKFANAAEFTERLDEFLDALRRGTFSPRKYILENLTLEQCAARYVAIARAVA